MADNDARARATTPTRADGAGRINRHRPLRRHPGRRRHRARTVTNVRAGAVPTPVAGIVRMRPRCWPWCCWPHRWHRQRCRWRRFVKHPDVRLPGTWANGASSPRLRQFSLPWYRILVGTFVLTVVFDLTVTVAGRPGAFLRVLHLAHGHASAFARPATCRRVFGVRLFGLFFSVGRSGLLAQCPGHPASSAGDAPADLMDLRAQRRWSSCTACCSEAPRSRWCWPTSTSSRCR